MKDETIDIITKNNKVIGQENISVAHQKGLRHRVSAVLLQREDGKYLIPTALEIKPEEGCLCHSAAGHVPAGESYEEALSNVVIIKISIESMTGKRSV